MDQQVDKIKVAFFPFSWHKGNPYMDLLADGLRQAGVDVEPITIDEPYIKWLIENRKIIKVLHFHWLHPLYSKKTKRQTITGFSRFVLRLLVARIIGYRIIWTMHNLFPHEKIFPLVDRFVRLFMVIIAHTIIVHCEKAKEELSRNFYRRNNVAVIPIGIYPQLSTKSVNPKKIRENMGISPTNLVFLSFGQIRPYKGLEDLIKLFKKVDNSDVTLIIAGSTKSSELERDLKILAAEDKGIILKIQWFDDIELHQLLSCADVIVLPFKDVLTSSTVMLAFSYAKPVVAPDLGCLPYLIDAQSGFLYDPNRPEGLKNAINETLNHKDQLVGMGMAALKKAQMFPWNRIGKHTSLAYRGDPNVNWDM